MSPSFKPPKPAPLPEEPNKKPLGTYVIVYSAIVMLVIGLLGFLLTQPTSH